MARFSGKVGFATTTEKAPGVWTDDVTEFPYFGDVVRAVKHTQAADKVNNDYSVSNSISIVADPYATQNFFAIRYVEWAGKLWTVSNVEIQSPRLLLSLGSFYDGPTP